jgi:histidinol-phosphate aminotransferase
MAVSEKLLQWIRSEIRELSAYHVPDSTGMVKLDAMENPYSLPDAVAAQLRQVVASAAINRYPDPSAAALTAKLRDVMQVPSACGMVLGNGSDELIQMLAMAVAGPKRCILSFEPGFVMYRMIARFTGMQYIGVPLAADFTLDMAATRAAIEKHEPALIFIAYPNNPSGNLFAREQIEEIIRLAPGLVVLDEAYHPFAQHSFMPALESYEQLLVMRTVSKMGLAGLRLGLLCGNPALIHEINKVRLPYNINVLTQQAAALVLDNPAFLDEQAGRIRAERESMRQRLAAMDTLEIYPSQANFILFRVLQGDADAVFARLKAEGVLIKNLNAPGPLQQCLRVTVGTPEENRLFIEALEIALGA